MPLAAQVSLYPLRTARLSPAIDKAEAAFRRHGLEISPGPMSTLIAGDDAAVFGALEEAFREAAGNSELVMVVMVSNACPVPGLRDRNVA